MGIWLVRIVVQWYLIYNGSVVYQLVNCIDICLVQSRIVENIVVFSIIGVEFVEEVILFCIQGFGSIVEV